MNVAYLADPATLAQTTYEVVLMGGGNPSPRCSADGGLPAQDYANANPFGAPYLAWEADSDCAPGAGDVNQSPQLLGIVSQMLGLRLAYSTGEVALQTALVMAPEDLPEATAPLLDDFYGTFPTLPAAQAVDATYASSGWLLSELAAQGGGGFTESAGTGVNTFSLLGLPIGPFGCGLLDGGSVPATCGTHNGFCAQEVDAGAFVCPGTAAVNEGLSPSCGNSLVLACCTADGG